MDNDLKLTTIPTVSATALPSDEAAAGGLPSVRKEAKPAGGGQ